MKTSCELERTVSRTRPGVRMDASCPQQSDYLIQEEHQATAGESRPCLNSGTNQTNVQAVKAMYQQSHEVKEKIQTPETKVSYSFVTMPGINPDRLIKAKLIVDKAIKAHKIFSVQGSYPVIREALRARGWVEQHMPRAINHKHKHDNNVARMTSIDAGGSDSDDNPDYEKGQDSLCSLMSRMLRNEMVYFYWTNRKNGINPDDLQKDQITNHFAKASSFTTKVGLCVNLRNLHWFDSANPDTFFPRCYRLGVEDEKDAFIEDYRRTACYSLLKYIVEKEHINKTCDDIQEKRKQCKQSRTLALSKTIALALKVSEDYLDSVEHRDIDISLEIPHKCTEEQWAEFIQNYYRIVHNGVEIESCKTYVNCCLVVLQKLKAISPQMDIDGTDNMWIVKPGAMSRGRGIKCAKRLDQILRIVQCDPAIIKDSKWVVQKYIEHPFLVHGTKFDVRQWFLVTDWNPLTVWFYKKCYMRFSTQPFSLHSVDRSVHLCNNSIQKHLRPSEQRHPGIPKDNMWSDEQFRAFLSGQGKEAQWETVVVPGMKKTVIYALQTTQDVMESRKNTFELYGADFILGYDLHPWLIEINTSPTMAPSTPVTARLCRAVQEDTLRVVLDRKTDPNANTGDFELIYRQAPIMIPQYLGANLLVEGIKIKSPCLLPPLQPSSSPASKHKAIDKEKE